MLRIMMKEWRDMLPFAALYLLACLVAGRGVAPALPALQASRAEVAALLVLGFTALAAARPFAGERALGTLEFTAALPVGRGTLFIAKTAAALAVALAAAFLIAACFGLAAGDLAPERAFGPLDTFQRTLHTYSFATAGVCAVSALLLFSATLIASLAGLGEFTALAVGATAWLVYAPFAMGLLQSHRHNPVLAGLLAALGLLAAGAHLFARGEPFDGSRGASDLGRAALVFAATVAALYALAVAASQPATEADLAARTLYGRADQAGVRTGPFATLGDGGSCTLRLRVPWWDPKDGMRGFVRREAWIDLASRAVRLVPSTRALKVTPSPDRKRCAWIEPRGAGQPEEGRLALSVGPGAPARPADFSGMKSFRGDQVDRIAWRPDGARLLATDIGSRTALVDPATGRATASYPERMEGYLHRHYWGEHPDAFAVGEFEFNHDQCNVKLRRLRVARGDALADPFAALGTGGGTLEALAVSGRWLLAVERSPAGRRLHAHPIDGGEGRVHPFPDGFTRPLQPGWETPLLRYDPAGALEGVAGAVEEIPRVQRPRGLLRWRLDLATGRESVTLLAPDGELAVVRDTAGRARLLGLAPPERGEGESDATRWYRVDPETFALAPANFTAEPQRTRVTWWPRWIRDAVGLGDVLWQLDDPNGLLRSFPMPPAGVAGVFEERTTLLPCPHCGR